MSKQLAEKHFANLHAVWIYDEQKYYEEEHDVESADDIPTSKLKESNYKDLRVVKDFLRRENQWKNGNMNTIPMSNI